MRITGIIPARFSASRFPGKPLAMIGGQSMIERVYRQACQAVSLDEVTVATDDSRIFDHVLAFGGKALMTSPAHRSGTERCAEAVQLLETRYDAVVNIQGDEPFISPRQIDSVASALQQREVSIATLYRKAPGKEATSPHVVKVVVNLRNEALYFSRTLIPYQGNSANNEESDVLVHVGIYGYKTDTLRLIAGLPFSALETAESLEQLRWLEHGMTVHAFETEEVNHPVDTPADIEKLKLTFGV